MNPQSSPRLQARIAGAAYLVVIIAGMFAEAVARGTIIVPGDAASTAANMVAHEQLFRWGFIANIVLLAFNVVLALIYFACSKW